MISNFDDFMIHQAANPVNEPEPSDRNFYDRAWLNGFDGTGDFLFEIGFGIYPNRRVMDAHFSVSIGGKQHCFRASRRAPRERSDMHIGPLRIEIVKPLRILRVVLEPNETGIECDLTFHARSAPTQEPRNVMYDDGRLIMNTTRFTQFGSWGGHFVAGGTRREPTHTETHGVRDRSWGVRPVGEPEMGAPGKLTTEPAVYWVWMPLFFDGFCTQFRSFEDPDGTPTELSAAIAPLYASMDDIPTGEEPKHQDMASATHRITWKPGTRLANSAELTLIARNDERYEITLEPLIRFQMLAIGYQHPEWGHAFWKGEEVIGSESWTLADLDPLDYKHIHTHHICRARMNDRVGIGTLETLVFGRHEPSGFKSILDGAP